ncbi:MAG: hypothetical protein WBD36_11800 [Bacteroidota bacterium]
MDSVAVGMVGGRSSNGARAESKRVLVFSPDADLARCLLVTLEDRFEIVRETRLEGFEQSLREVSPDLVLIDLSAFSADIERQLEVIRRNAPSMPIMILRAYVSLPPEINKAITEMTDLVFYKPVDVDLISQAIENLLR